MNLASNDKVLVFSIKYAPILFVLILSLFTTQIVLIQKEENFKNEIKEIEKNYYASNKARIKEEVEKVYAYIKSEKEKTKSLLKESIKNRVYEAHTIASNLYKKEIAVSSKEKTFETIKNTLGSIIFNKGRGYFFIDDVNGVSLLQPLDPEIVGKNFLEYKDTNGYQFVKTIVNTIKNKSERFDSYYWYKSNEHKETHKKISFYKYFEPYNIAIGTGEYIDDFENSLKKKIINYIQNIRYADDAYVFLIDYEGTYLAHNKKSLVGVNRLHYKNKIGQYLAKDIIEFAKTTNGDYMSYKDTINIDKLIENNEKTSYIKRFDEWNWVIGTGFYTEKLNLIINNKKLLLEEIKNKSVKNIIVVSVFITLILLIISFFISKILEKRLLSYKLKIEKEINENREKDNIMFQQAKMAMMGEMIANIAHQWRQPLSQISTVSTGVKMQEELGILNTKELNQNMESINNAVQYLSQTIDDFRNFFSPSKTYANFDIVHSIEKTLNLVDSQLKSNDIVVIKDLKSYRINNLENELSQVFINILKNAKEALIENNKDKKRLIFIKTYDDENNIYISIKDNAKGIPKKILENIFKPYFTTKGKDGTGLGLFMCKNILNRNIEGDLITRNVKYEFEGTKYKGAEFLIKIAKIEKD